MVNALLKSLIVDDLDNMAQVKFNEIKTKTHDKQSNTTTKKQCRCIRAAQ